MHTCTYYSKLIAKNMQKFTFYQSGPLATNNPYDHLIWSLGKHIVRQMFLSRRFTEKSLGTNSVGEVRKFQ